jgi:hypothetical protein
MPGVLLRSYGSFSICANSPSGLLGVDTITIKGFGNVSLRKIVAVRINTELSESRPILVNSSNVWLFEVIL